LPKGFNYPIIKPPKSNYLGLPFIGNNPTTTLNPQEKGPAESMIDPSFIPLIVKAREHKIVLFYYGNINYTDVFAKLRTTPFCFVYLPDNPRDDQFGQCDEHNTPEQGK
jgi:hypothetical protein